MYKHNPIPTKLLEIEAQNTDNNETNNYNNNYCNNANVQPQQTSHNNNNNNKLFNDMESILKCDNDPNEIFCDFSTLNEEFKSQYWQILVLKQSSSIHTGMSHYLFNDFS